MNIRIYARKDAKLAKENQNKFYAFRAPGAPATGRDFY